MTWADSKTRRAFAIGIFCVDAVIAVLVVALSQNIITAVVFGTPLLIATIIDYQEKKVLFARIALYYFVVVIILLVTSVFLASMACSSHCKSPNAAVKSDLNAVRSMAELYASDHNGSYQNLCIDDTDMEKLLAHAAAETGKRAVLPNAAQTNDSVVCNDSPTSFVVSAPLSQDGNYWCVDSSGAAKETKELVAANAKSCPD